MELSENNFKKKIWENVDYFKSIYLNNPLFFEPKKNQIKPSDKFYIEKTSLEKWAQEISNKYNPWNDDLEKLIKDLLEVRKGQYSNGTLFSSSRLIAEIFREQENRRKLLKWLKLDSKYKPEDFKWILEYRLPIFGKNDPRPAQMDLAIENEDLFICIESKMKEIYKKDYSNDFELRYQKLLDEFKKDFSVTKIETDGGKKKMFRLSLNGLENNNFYFKQQICHLLAIRKKKEEDSKKNKNKKYLFLNFVFDISDIKNLEDANGANKRYESNEKIVFSKLSKYFDASDITYGGLLTQKVLLQIDSK